jgi:hypothetical protein
VIQPPEQEAKQAFHNLAHKKNKGFDLGQTLGSDSQPA